MIYRREIDGLRALAVLSVIFFHLGFQVFSGGFVGVDIFFVISGYLITSIIVAEKTSEGFSLINFYERRARRILPALFVVLLACLPLALLWMFPPELKSFSESLMAVPTFISNIYFWRTSGYFASAAELKPLLHTWSLAVEEQFYIFFPLFLMLTWRLRERWILTILGLVAGASLALSQWTSYAFPVAGFFVLPTRAWELLAGAFIALYFSRQRSGSDNRTSKRALHEFGSGIGLLLIGWGVFGFDKHTPFPSLYALVPVLGASLIIVFAGPQTIVGQLLGSKGLVGVGLISYSAYLWHQPLIAFAYLRMLDELPSQVFLAGLIAINLLLAYLTWRYVETPFRNKQLVTRRHVFLGGALGSLFFIGLGLLIQHHEKEFSQFDKKQLDFLSYFENSAPAFEYFAKIDQKTAYREDCNLAWRVEHGGGTIDPSCYVTTKENSIFIWGDSHAQQLYYGINRSLPDKWGLLQIATSGCVAAIDAAENSKNLCASANLFAYKKIKEVKPQVVIIGQQSSHNVTNMTKIADALISVGVGKVIFTGPVPHWRANLPNLIVANFLPDIPVKAFYGLKSEVLKLDREIKLTFPKTPNVFYVSLIDYFCNENGCAVYYGNDPKSGITTWDYGHLTPIASYYLARDWLSKLLFNPF